MMTSELPAAPPRSLSERKRKRYIRILDVALALMERNGFDGVSVRELADLAEIAPATIYNVFGSKEGLLSAAIEFRTTTFIREALNADMQGFEGLMAINQLMAESSARSNELIRSIAVMLSRDSSLFGVRQIYRSFHCRFISDIQKAGGLAASARPDALASFMMMSHNAALNYWASRELDPEHLPVLFDLETCNILCPVAQGSTLVRIRGLYDKRMKMMENVEFGEFLSRSNKISGSFDIQALME